MRWREERTLEPQRCQLGILLCERRAPRRKLLLLSDSRSRCEASETLAHAERPIRHTQAESRTHARTQNLRALQLVVCACVRRLGQRRHKLLQPQQR